MLSDQDNDILCRVGPGTPMGDLFRQYWTPAIRSDELPTPDCPPLRVRLLGEDMIGFRTTSGEVGLMQIKYQTARGLGYTGTRAALYDPATNLEWGMRYLSGAHRLAGGNLCGTLAKSQGGHGTPMARPTSIPSQKLLFHSGGRDPRGSVVPAPATTAAA